MKSAQARGHEARELEEEGPSSHDCGLLLLVLEPRPRRRLLLCECCDGWVDIYNGERTVCMLPLALKSLALAHVFRLQASDATDKWVVEPTLPSLVHVTVVSPCRKCSRFQNKGYKSNEG